MATQPLLMHQHFKCDTKCHDTFTEPIHSVLVILSNESVMVRISSDATFQHQVYESHPTRPWVDLDMPRHGSHDCSGWL